MSNILLYAIPIDYLLSKFNFKTVHNSGELGAYQPGRFENLTAQVFFNRRTSYNLSN